MINLTTTPPYQALLHLKNRTDTFVNDCFNGDKSFQKVLCARFFLDASGSVHARQSMLTRSSHRLLRKRLRRLLTSTSARHSICRCS
jgi:hypothetical protein